MGSVCDFLGSPGKEQPKFLKGIVPCLEGLEDLLCSHHHPVFLVSASFSAGGGTYYPADSQARWGPLLPGAHVLSASRRVNKSPSDKHAKAT